MKNIKDSNSINNIKRYKKGVYIIQLVLMSMNKILKVILI